MTRLSADTLARHCVATAEAIRRSPDNVVPLKYVALAMHELEVDEAIDRRIAAAIAAPPVTSL